MSAFPELSTAIAFPQREGIALAKKAGVYKGRKPYPRRTPEIGGSGGAVSEVEKYTKRFDKREFIVICTRHLASATVPRSKPISTCVSNRAIALAR